MAVDSKKEFVCPGDFLAFEEEFLAGINAFENADGKVFSAVIGRPIYDEDKRIVSVKKQGKMVLPLSVGTTVIARVQMIKKNSVVVSIMHAEKNGVQKTIFNTMAMIPVSKVSRNYVENLSDVFKVGDIVKARICMVNKYAIDLETSAPDLGVVKGYCGKCRHEMDIAGFELKCPACKSMEPRKISRDYNKI